MKLCDLHARGVAQEVRLETESPEPVDFQVTELLLNARLKNHSMSRLDYASFKKVHHTQGFTGAIPTRDLFSEEVWYFSNGDKRTFDEWVCGVCDRMASHAQVCVLHLCGPCCAVDAVFARMLFPWMVYGIVHEDGDANLNLVEIFASLLTETTDTVSGIGECLLFTSLTC